MNDTEGRDRLEERLRAPGPTTGSLERMHATLAERAAADQTLDVAYRLLDSPVGSLLIARTPEGVVRIAFANQGHDAALADLAARVSPRILEAHRPLDEASRELEEYFAGARRVFEVTLDLRLTAGFRRAVLERLRLVDYGSTLSYGVLAASIGHPRAARAVGSACATNPIPLLVPCHRVLPSTGKPGNYAGGADAKKVLLSLEGRLEREER